MDVDHLESITAEQIEKTSTLELIQLHNNILMAILRRLDSDDVSAREAFLLGFISSTIELRITVGD